VVSGLDRLIGGATRQENIIERKTKSILVFLISCGFASGAWAACLYQGNAYPTGTKIGGLTCQADGTWR
jgi:hypothetical protein